MTDANGQFDAIDTALSAASHAIGELNRAAALAGIFGAIAAINALAAPTQTAVFIPAERVPAVGESAGAELYAILGRGREGDSAGLQKRLDDVLTSVQKIIDTFRPDSFTISAGFPFGVNVSLTWDLTPKADPS